MKTQLVILVTSIMVVQAIAQETNNAAPPAVKSVSDNQDHRIGHRDRHNERKLKLMERALKRIGITEEEQKQIIALQRKHKERMKANMQRVDSARKELSKLQDEGAGEEALEAAILKVSDAHAEQLRILVKNRMEMERILGKEKSARFMENARTAFRKHGRRGGPGLPPRPGLSNQRRGKITPPPPHTSPPEEDPPPAPPL